MRQKKTVVSMIVFLFAVGAFASGCKKEDDQQSKDGGKKKKNDPEQVAVKLTKIKADTLKKRIESEKGNVVVVDFWFTS